jgi:hypothetical protein
MKYMSESINQIYLNYQFKSLTGVTVYMARLKNVSKTYANKLGKVVFTVKYIDANLNHDIVTGMSVT